jgi:hypothetical protein
MLLMRKSCVNSDTCFTGQGFWQGPLDGINVNGKSVIGELQAIFDTGASLIVGDPDRVQTFASSIGATSAPDVGDGLYTSTLSSSAGLPPHILIFVSQYLATSTLPSLFPLQGRRSQFLPVYLTSDKSPRALTLASWV